jgi:hypothetical protein
MLPQCLFVLWEFRAQVLEVVIFQTGQSVVVVRDNSGASWTPVEKVNFAEMVVFIELANNNGLFSCLGLDSDRACALADEVHRLVDSLGHVVLVDNDVFWDNEFSSQVINDSWEEILETLSRADVLLRN